MGRMDGGQRWEGWMGDSDGKDGRGTEMGRRGEGMKKEGGKRWKEGRKKWGRKAEGYFRKKWQWVW